jgi:hypothetical protein
MALAGGQLRAGACTAFLLLLSVRSNTRKPSGHKKGEKRKIRASNTLYFFFFALLFAAVFFLLPQQDMLFFPQHSTVL